MGISLFLSSKGSVVVATASGSDAHTLEKHRDASQLAELKIPETSHFPHARAASELLARAEHDPQLRDCLDFLLGRVATESWRAAFKFAEARDAIKRK